MPQSRIEGDLHVNGTATFKTLDIPASSVVDADVSGSADIAYSKVESLQSFTHSTTGTAASATQNIGFVRGASGTLLSITAGSVVAAIGAATVTVDLKKNGTTMLSSVITLDNANTAYIGEAGTLSVTSLAAGDCLTLVIVATAGGGTLPTGLAVTVYWKEKPS